MLGTRHRTESGSALPHSIGAILMVCAFALALSYGVASATEPRLLTLDPNVAGTDLESLSYEDAKTALAGDADVMIPLTVAGMATMEFEGINVYFDDTKSSIAITGDTALLNVDGAGLVTAVWDDPALTPEVSVGVKFADIFLSDLNGQWGTAQDAPLGAAWVGLAPSAHTVDPDDLPTEVAAFYDAPFDVQDGVAFRGDVDLSQIEPLQNALQFVGHDGSSLRVDGTLASSAAALGPDGTDSQLQDLSLTATITSDGGTELPWLKERTTTVDFTLSGGSPSISFSDDIVATLDGEDYEFTGGFAYDHAASSIDIGLAFAPASGQTFDAFGLDALSLTGLELGLSKTFGDDASFAAELSAGFDLNSKPLTLNAAIETGGGTTSLSLSLEGDITAEDIVALAGEFMDVGDVDASALGDFALTDVTFDLSKSDDETAVAVKAGTTINGFEVDILISVRRVVAEGLTKLLVGINGSGTVSFEDLLDTDFGGFDIQVSDPNLTIAQGWGGSIDPADLSGAETDYFESFLGSPLPDPIELVDGLNFSADMPLDTFGDTVTDALGIVGDPNVTLSGSLGVNLSELKSGAAFEGLALSAQLPTLQPDGFPDWLTLGSTGDEGEGWSIDFEYSAAESSIVLGAGGPFEVELDETTMTGDLRATFERSGGETTVTLAGSLADWAQPFGVEWLSINNLALEASFGSGGFSGSFSGEAEIGGKTFSVSIELSAGGGGGTNATIKVKLEDEISFLEVAEALDPTVELPSELEDLTIGPLSITVNVGSGGTSVSLLADTSVPSPSGGAPLASRLYFEVGGANFILGIRPKDDLSMSQFVPSDVDLPFDVTVSDASFLISKNPVNKPSDELTDEAFGFFNNIYGCDEASADLCDPFSVEFPSGVGFGGRITLPNAIDSAADAIWIDAEEGVTLEGQLPIFGAPAPGTFKLTATLPSIKPPASERPDWFESGNVKLEVTETSVAFDGGMTIRLRNEATPCPGVELFIVGNSGDKACYDRLRGSIRALISIGGAPKITLQGEFAALDEFGDPTGVWHKAFGEDWLAIKKLVLQMGVEFSGTPTFTFGFLGDVIFNEEKDLRASISLGIRTIPAPPFVIPELRGLTARSAAGLELEDLVDLGEKVSGLDLDIDDLPNIALRNLDFMFGLESNPGLCITPGLRIAGDLYIDPTGSAPAFANDECKAMPEPDPEPTQRCKDNAANGCFATMRFEFGPQGILADGSMQGFTVGPITIDDALLRMRLTSNEQSFFLKGGADIGTFATGNLEVYFSKTDIKFQGDVSLFDGAFKAYLEGEGVFSLSNPSFSFRAVLRADFTAAAVSILNNTASALKGVIIGMDAVWDIILDSGGDPFKAISLMSQKLTSLNLGLSTDLSNAIAKVGQISETISTYFPDIGLVFDLVLNGYDFGTFGGVPGTYIPATRTCVTTVSGGSCWTTPPWSYNVYDPIFGEYLFTVSVPGIPGFWVEPACNGGVGFVQNGTCYTVPPFHVGSIPGVCKAAWDTNNNGKCSLSEFSAAVIEPGIISAFQSATGSTVPPGESLTNLLDQAAKEIQGTKFEIECAEFKGSLGTFADGKKADISIATRLNLFGWKLDYGVKWDFAGAMSGNVGTAIQSIVNTIFDPDTDVTCEGLPQDAPPDSTATGIRLNLSDDSITEGDSTTLSGEALGNFTGEKSIKIEWGDGSSDTVTTSSKLFSKAHSYADDDPTGTSGNSYIVKATIQDTSGKSNTKVVAVANALPQLSFNLDNSTINEDGSVTVSGAFTDAGKPDTHAISLNWGDGTASVSPTRSGSNGSYTFTATHKYLDDSPTASQSDIYKVTASVTDDDTGLSTLQKDLTVNDVAPSSVTFAPTSVMVAGENGEGVPADLNGNVTEGAYVTYSGSFTDPGSLDTHTVTVNWGDGSTQTVGVAGNARTFTASHVFVDDDPTNTVKDEYTVVATVKDDDTKTGSVTRKFDLHNVAPSQITLQNSGSETTHQENEEISLVGSFFDPGVADTHVVAVDWGDGSTDTTLNLAAGVAVFDATHKYLDDNPTNTPEDTYTITVTVTDDDTGTNTVTSTVLVQNVAPEYTSFEVEGSEIDERGNITVTKTENNNISFEAEFSDPGTLDDYDVEINWGDGWIDDPGDDYMPEDPIEREHLEVGDRDFAANRDFGDNGTYTVTVTVTDDDTELDSTSFTVVMDNVDPTAVINRASAITVQGVPTFIGKEKAEMNFDSSSVDPGSDDIYFLWDFDDGISLNNPHLLYAPDEDLFPSPQVSPRSETDRVKHTWQEACLYFMDVNTEDDDAGESPVDTAPVVIQGLQPNRLTLGQWNQQYKPRSATDKLMPLARVRCYLDIVGHMSAVFHENLDVSTLAKAAPNLDGAGSTEKVRLERAMFTAWLDFANGAFDYNEMVDTNKDGVGDARFSAIMTAAESAYLNPTSTSAQLKVHRDKLNALP